MLTPVMQIYGKSLYMHQFKINGKMAFDGDVWQWHPHMPLVLDDVLITSDDERAANVLRALARFAEGGQGMIFTHHRHLIDVARAALDDQALAVHSL